MIEWTGIFKAVGSIFKPIADTIDNLHTSEEERLKAKSELTGVQANVALKWMEMEKAAMDLQAKIVQAEMQHGNWLTRTWRPIVMLTFTAIIVLAWFGYTPTNMPYEMMGTLFSVIKWGLGGYVVGRSAEKVIPKIVESMKKPEG